jgi:hypothetical protein
MDQNELRKLIQNIIKETRKINLKEDDFDDEDDLGIYTDFDRDEFSGPAMAAAKADIEASGDEFVPLGKSKFEKNLDANEFVSDLERQKLNLKKDKEERNRLKKAMDIKKNHEKKFGAGSLNETGEWSGDEDDQAWMEALRNELDLIAGNLNMGVHMQIKGVHGFDKYQGPYAEIDINGDHYKVWTTEDNMLWIEGFPIDNTGGEGKRPGFEGFPDELADAINKHYSDKPHFPIMDFMNENGDDFYEGPQPGDMEYHNEFEKMPIGLSKFNDLDWRVIYDQLVEGVFQSKNDLKEAGLTNEDIALLEYYNILSIGPGVSMWEDTWSYEDFVSAVKNAYDHSFPDPITENNGGPLKDAFDTTSLYKFLADAMYAFKEGDASHMDYAEFAQFLEEELTKNFHISSKKYLPFSVNESAIDRPKDAEGQPITLRARVEDLESKAVGRVVRFGVDENGKQTVHIDWMQNFGAAIPSSITYPEKIVVRDDTRIVREEELEESNIRSHANGRGQNKKPGNYPQALKRKGLKEGLENTTPTETSDEVYLVVDSPFNRAHYKDLVGQSFDDVPPGYAQVKVVKKSELEAEKAKKYDVTQEDYDYAGEEVRFHNQQAIDDINKDDAAKQIIPKELIQFYLPGSFNPGNASDYDGSQAREYKLRIPKQADETVKDIQNFIKNEEGEDYTGPGAPYKKVNVYVELEKTTNTWIIEVTVTTGLDI